MMKCTYFRFIFVLMTMASVVNINAQSIEPYLFTVDADWIQVPAAHFVSSEKGHPLTFATPIEINLPASSAGTVTPIDNGMYVWTLGIHSEWAENLSILLSNVSLNADEYIYIYAPNDTAYQLFTSQTKLYNEYLQTFPVDGDSLIVEYVGPQEFPNISLVQVNCGFMALPHSQHNYSNKSGNFGDANGDCEIDVRCNANISDIKQAVCRLIVNGSDLCTGVLINNTANDGKPYVLTSAHCFTGNKLKSNLTTFNFENTACDGVTYATDYTVINGAELLLLDETSDMALMLLSDTPPASACPYYAGWNVDASNIETGSLFYAIHHPAGDVRKVSQAATVALKSYTSDKTNSGLSFDKNSHWRVSRWLSGTTEGGSSGAPLFDSNGRVLGGLTGGAASCNCTSSGCYDFFWAMSKAWNAIPDNVGTKSLAEYLDPISSGADKYDGAYIVADGENIHDIVYGADYKSAMLSERPAVGLGYICGHNAYKTAVVAEGFSDSSLQTTISSVYITSALVQSSNKQTFNIVFYSDKSGKPGDVLHTISNISNSKLKTDRSTAIELTEPITINGAFHIGVELTYGNVATDTLAFYHSELSSDELTEDNNRSHFYVNNDWYSYDYFTTSAAGADVFFGFNGIVTTQSVVTETKDAFCPDYSYTINDGEVVITSDNLKNAEVYDLSGRKIMEQNAQGGRIVLNLRGSARGIVIVNINFEKDSQKSIKVLVN
ncbi:MAG: trypsin-like peptidase domain-containing protein [Marinilabiliaceae bacterium]|nr:trypsin-like peptidase domain-containing protein [Marinilabiliaceae bacterium]